MLRTQARRHPAIDERPIMGRSIIRHPAARAEALDAYETEWSDRAREWIAERDGVEQDDVTDEQVWEYRSYADLDDWGFYKEGTISFILEAFPSLYEVDESEHDEVNIVARNGHTALVLSEYGGMAAWALVPLGFTNRHYGDFPTGLSERWISQVKARFEGMFPDRYQVMGRFSDGTSVYQKAAA